MEENVVNCKNGIYLASIIDDSAIMCDEVIESFDKGTKTNPKNFNEKKAACDMQNFYVLFAFLLITIVSLMIVIIYCYMIKYQAK